MALGVGQKVQCIAGGKGWFRLGSAEPELGPMKGQVLRVQGFDFDASTGETYLAFAEFPSGTFFSECFRPLVRPATDISVFQAMLNPSRKRKAVEHV